MPVPILLDGEKCGELEIRREGAYTLFSAACAPRPGLHRLSVFGGGRSGYLGVLVREGDVLSLRRRLSRAAMSGFPGTIEYAADRESPPPQAPARQKAESPPPPPPGRSEAWQLCPDGTMIGADERGALLALPCALRRRVPGVDLREIGGRLYLVFRT